MKHIIQSYRQAEAQVNSLLGDGRTCPDQATSQQIRMIVHGWQQSVIAQLDDMSALRFEGVSAALATPMSWHSFTEEGASAYTSFLTMKKQIQWLAERYEAGNAQITVKGSNNQIVVGNSNNLEGGK